MTIGERIAKCRKEKKLSQEYIAESLEVSRQAVSKWENDQSEPDTNNLIKLARLFNVSVEYLANGEEENIKVVYIEKNIPILKIIGLILLGLGGLSLLFGIIIPYMFGIAIILIAFGLLLILLKKEGLILGSIIITIGTILFLIQGFFFGIDTPILCLISSISVGIPILIYSLIKLILKIKKERIIKNNLRFIKNFINIFIIVSIVVTAIIIPASIVHKNRKNAFAKAMWFSSERLKDYMVEGLPAPKDIDCINMNNEKILFYFNTDTYNIYLESIYNYLINKNFKHLGTKGELLYQSNEEKIYEFIKHKKNYYYGSYGHSGFNNNENPDDYYFIYSDSIIDELTGEIDCYIIHFDYVEISNIHVNKKNYRYNVEMTIYKESSLEGYRYKI